MFTIVSAIAAGVILWIAGALTRFAYRRGWSASIVMPVLSSISDVVGYSLLIAGFFVIRGNA